MSRLAIQLAMAAVAVRAAMFGRPLPPRPLHTNASSEACKRTRVAVCLTGHPRTFVREHVVASILHALLAGLRRSHAHVDVFAVLGTGDASQKRMPGWNFSRSVADDVAVAQALARLAPRVIERIGDPLINPRCTVPPKFGDAARMIAQPTSWARCLDHVENAESVDGSEYDWIVRARPDAYWCGQHVSLCGTDQIGERTLLLHSQYPNVGGMGDMHFALPRAAAPVVFRDMLQTYSSCDGALPFADMEHFLQVHVAAASDKLGLEVGRMRFPFVLARASEDQPSALRMFVGLDPAMRTSCMRAYPHIEKRDNATR